MNAFFQSQLKIHAIYFEFSSRLCVPCCQLPVVNSIWLWIDFLLFDLVLFSCCSQSECHMTHLCERWNQIFPTHTFFLRRFVRSAIRHGFGCTGQECILWRCKVHTKPWGNFHKVVVLLFYWRTQKRQTANITSDETAKKKKSLFGCQEWNGVRAHTHTHTSATCSMRRAKVYIFRFWAIQHVKQS